MSDENSVIEAKSGPRELTTRYGRLTVPNAESDLIGRFLSRYGEWAWFEAIFAASLIPDGARVLDVGAFAGTFGLGVGQWRRLGLLCFVEANREVAPLLKRNVAYNSNCPCMVIEALVAGAEARGGIGQSQPGNLGSTAFSVNDDPESPDGIRATTLAGLRIEHGAFDLIKLDIEGMELDALRGDADFLAHGKTTLWIEANEDPRTLDVARVLLSWNMKLFYFAFPAHNPNNFNGDPEPIFPFAFEAGLLAASAPPPSLSPELKNAGCILTAVKCVDDLKDALWRTPRWGMTEWEGAASMPELTALAGRSIRGQSFAKFLVPGAVVAQGAEMTIWQRLEAAQADLEDVRTRQILAEEAAQGAQILAAERSNQLAAEQRRHAEIEETLQATVAERSNQLEKEQRRHAEMEEALQATAAERLNQLVAEQRLREQIEETHHRTVALADERLDQLRDTRLALNTIQTSTVWRASKPLRVFVSRQPGLHAVLRKTRASLERVLRLRRRRENAGLSPVPFVPARAGSAATIDPGHREAMRPHFDSEYYRVMNQDVLAPGIDPLDHFMQQGWREERDPSPAFDVTYYLKSSPDVAAAGVNPVLHYIWAGMAEGRLPRRPLDISRQILAAAVSPRVRAADWTGAIARSTPLSPAALAVALLERRLQAGTIVSVSHDDYAANFGGVQNLIADEQRAFEASGWRYLHISPAAPLPLLAEHGPAEDYHLRLRLNGVSIGVVRFTDLVSVLTALRGKGTKLAFVFHHLMGHVPELLATLPNEADGDPVVWVHDFFTLCPSFTLMRNDVKFCGAPLAESAACGVCTAGTERRNHAARMGAFFEKIHPTVIAPSAVTLNFWRRRADLPYAGITVVPLARLTMSDGDPIVTPNEAPLRVAHLGGASLHKGWPVFEQLAFAHASDPRYEFYHLGVGGTPSSRYIHEPVRVSPEQRNAMIEAIVGHRIDVVILWSLWPETFCFTVHEALAGGAFVIARENAGNVWPAVQANAIGQGCAVKDEAGLFQLFDSGEIRTLVGLANRFRGTLHPGGNTAEFLLNDRTTTAALSDTAEAQL